MTTSYSFRPKRRYGCLTNNHMIAKTGLGTLIALRSVLILVFGVVSILHRMRVVFIHLLLSIAICAYRTMLSWLLLLSISTTGTVIIGTWSPRWTSPSRRSLASTIPIIPSFQPQLPVGLSYEYNATIANTMRIMCRPSIPQHTLWVSRSTSVSCVSVSLELPRIWAMDTIRRPVRRSMPARSDAYLSEFTINPALPEGVNMDPATGTITGSFRNTTSNQVYTVTGRNEYWYNFPGTTSVLPTSFFLLLHQLYTHPTSTPNLCRKLVIATHLLRSRYIQRCGMNRYIQYHVSVHTFSYQPVVPTGAYYLMVST